MHVGMSDVYEMLPHHQSRFIQGCLPSCGLIYCKFSEKYSAHVSHFCIMLLLQDAQMIACISHFLRLLQYWSISLSRNISAKHVVDYYSQLSFTYNPIAAITL